MTSANIDLFSGQLVTQHACTHERVFQMQLVDAAHECQIDGTYRLGQVVHRASADFEQFGLLGNRQFVISVNHGFALSNPALVSALSKKSFSKVS